MPYPLLHHTYEYSRAGGVGRRTFFLDGVPASLPGVPASLPFVELYLLLVERLEATWFHTSIRKNTEDRWRFEIKMRRTARGVRLLAYICHRRDEAKRGAL